MSGGSWASPRLLWLPTVNTVPWGAPGFLLSSAAFSRVGSEVTDTAPYLNRDGKSSLADPSTFTPKLTDAHPGPAGTRKYLEMVLMVLASRVLQGSSGDHERGPGKLQASFGAQGSPTTENRRLRSPLLCSRKPGRSPRLWLRASRAPPVLASKVSPEG